MRETYIVIVSFKATSLFSKIQGLQWLSIFLCIATACLRDVTFWAE